MVKIFIRPTRILVVWASKRMPVSITDITRNEFISGCGGCSCWKRCNRMSQRCQNITKLLPKQQKFPAIHNCAIYVSAPGYRIVNLSE